MYYIPPDVHCLLTILPRPYVLAYVCPALAKLECLPKNNFRIPQAFSFIQTFLFIYSLFFSLRS